MSSAFKSRQSLTDSSFFRTKGPGFDITERTTFREVQEVNNNPHRWPPRGIWRDADIGGGFSNRKAFVSSPGGIDIHVENSSRTRVDSGRIYPFHHGNTSFLLTGCPTPSTDSELDAYGTTAIARTRPTKPLVAMDQFLGELRDLPKFAVDTWKNRTKGFMALAKGGSKDYLNAQFGWIPFLSDISKFAKTSHSAQKHIDQFLRDSGKTVRRRYGLPGTTSTSLGQTYTWYGAPVCQLNLVQSAGIVQQETVVTSQRWFSGAYRYLVPGYDELFSPETGKIDLAKLGQQSEQLAHKLYGLRIDPHTLWSLAPWSWAIDWVSNAGDVVDNMSAFSSDHLVLKYGYVMETLSKTERFSVTKPMVLSNGFRASSIQTVSYVTKSRRRATPYGFGLNPGTFSARQWSIIAALGISKKPSSLDF